MKRKLLLAGLLALALILGGCAANAPDASQTASPTAAAQAPVMSLASSAPLPGDINPSAEEDTDAEYVDPALAAAVNATGVPSVIFAGATPIPLNPVDMPTPTKAPPLTFTYAAYTAGKLGLTFESAAGYTVDDSASDTFVLREPAELVKDNYPVEISLSVKPVTNSYKSTDIPADLRALLAEIGKVNYQKWEPSTTAGRSLMDAQGHFANYRGVLTDGTIVRGRIHMALLPNNRLLTLHISNPANFNTDYDAVYAQIRKTIKAQ